MPKSSWAPPKAMRGKCERRGGNINADAANAEVFAGGGCSQGASFVPMAAISRRWRGGRNIIIRVRASGCGESALNPPTSPPIPRRRSAPAPAERHSLPAHFHSPRSDDARPPTTQHIPRRRPSPVPAQRHALPEHFRSPTQRRRTPASCAMHSSPPSQHIPRRRPAPAPAQRRALPEHFRSPTQRRRTSASYAMHSSPTSQHIPRRKPAPAPAQRHALPKHFLTPSPSRHTPAGCAIHSSPTSRPIPRRPHNTFPVEDLLPPPHSDAHCRALSLPPAAQTPARRPHNPFPAEGRRPSPQRHAASPSVPLRAQKNGTAQCMCDAECFGRPSLRSVIWVGEPRAVRRRCGALTCRRGA